MSPAVAVIGAECSGKTTLATGLASELGGTLVAERLRAFVARHGRPPTRAEQAAVMAEQIAAERSAAADGGWVVSDSSALMTAVYSVYYFGDDSLVEQALAHHRSAHTATLWCGIDLPWRADAGQRDGPEARRAVHDLIGETLRAGGLDALQVGGSRPERLHQALARLRGAGGPDG